MPLSFPKLKTHSSWPAWHLPSIAVICVGAVLRVAHLLRTHSGLDSDEAVVGLMAKHILEGRELPVFYYGQHYFGALEAYLTAPFFALLGVSSWALRIVPLLSSLFVAALVGLLARRLWNPQAAWLAAALASVPPLFSFNFQLLARGGFPESMALTLLLTWMAVQLMTPGWATRPRVFGFGLLTGLLLFVYQPILVPVTAFLLFSTVLRPRPSVTSYLTWTGGALLGASPLLLYNLAYPLATVLEAAGQKFLGMQRLEYQQTGLLNSLWTAMSRRLEDLLRGGDHLWTVLAGRPWSESGWAELLAGAFLLGMLLAIVWWSRRFLPPPGHRLDRARLPSAAIPALLLALTLLAGFLRPRYLLLCFPLAVVLIAGLAGPLSKRHPLMPGLLLLLPITFALQQVRFLQSTDPSGHLPLVECLQEAGVQRGYASYWLAYSVVFLSREEIILSPAADPQGVDRYLPYTRQVKQADQSAAVWIIDSPAHRHFIKRLDELALDLPSIPCGQALLYPAGASSASQSRP